MPHDKDVNLDDATRVERDDRQGMLEALDGAEKVKIRLRAYFSLGEPSLEDLTYAVKARVKDYESGLAKLEDRREEDPTYGAEDIDDIVGVRLVTLYEADKVKVVRALLALINYASDVDQGLFERNPYQEILIYQVPNSEKVTTRIEAVFEEFGLKKLVEVKSKDTQYSSIHIILHARGMGSGGPKIIPVEVQVRSAFEDVWGEIDHSLKYKRRNKKMNSAKDAELLDSFKERIIDLKRSIDISSVAADRIRKDLMTLDRNTDNVEASVPILKDTQDFVTNSELVEPSQKKEIIKILDKMDKAISMGDSAKSDMEFNRYIKSLKNIVEEWSRFIDFYAEEGLMEPSSENELYYHLNMEKAFCYLKLSESISQHFISNEKDRTEEERRKALEEGEAFLEKAISIYKEMASLFSKKSIVHYRYSQAFSAANDTDLAIFMCEKALKCLKKDEELDQNHWLRLVIPRTLGFLYWKQSAMLEERGKAIADPEYQFTKRLDNLQRACDVTKQAKRIDIEGYWIGELSVTSEEAALMTFNNLLYYGLELVRLGCQEDELQDIGMSYDYMRSLQKELLDWRKAAPKNQVMILDTLWKSAREFGDQDQAKEFAESLVNLAEDPEYLHNTVEDEEFKEAKRFLTLVEDEDDTEKS